MSRKRSNARNTGIKVTYYDPANHRSISHTIMAGASDLDDVAHVGYEALRRRWLSTDIYDRRHKWR